MENKSKEILDLKLTTMKMKSLLEEVVRINEHILNEIERTQEDDVILMNQFKLLYHTVSEIPQIIENSLSSDLKERIENI